jgi:hypothetical protein
MIFKKIHIYLEVFLYLFYPFYYQNCYICCIVDMFLKELLKTDICNQDFTNFIFCWPCISICVCNETNLMHYFSSVYSVTIPLNVSGLLVAHHQEITMYIYSNWYVLYWREDCSKLLEYLHVITKCETYSCYLNFLKDIGKLSMFIHKHLDTHTI